MAQTIKLTGLHQRVRPILCIKVLRHTTGYLLKQSKEIVDALRKVNPNPVLIEVRTTSDLTQLGEYFKFKVPLSSDTYYQISTLAGTIKFWPVKIKVNGNGWANKIEVHLGTPEIIVNTPKYDNTERMNGRWEEIVQDSLQERGDIHYNEGIMLFQLPPNDRDIKYVAYPTSCIDVIYT